MKLPSPGPLLIAPPFRRGYTGPRIQSNAMKRRHFHVLFQRQLRGLCPPGEAGGRGAQSAYLVGSGLAAPDGGLLSGAGRQMPGRNIHILEKEPIAGGACDGWHYEGLGYVMRGGREMDNHFEVMWDLFRSIRPSRPRGVSVLDEYYWLNKRDPNYSLMRATVNGGRTPTPTAKFGLSDQGAMEIMKLFFTPRRGPVRQAHHGRVQQCGAGVQLLALLAHHVRL